MEGFLTKKGRGESMLGRRNWKKRWFVLEGSTLTYYEDFDLKTGKPSTHKGDFDVLGCTITTLPDSKHDFAFLVKHETRKDAKELQLKAEDESSLDMWIDVLTMAASGDPLFSSADHHAKMRSAYYAALSLDEKSSPGEKEISAAYRNAAKTAHPDRGGSAEQFDAIQKAFEALNKIVQDEATYNKITFEAVVRKTPTSGLGLRVAEHEEGEEEGIFVKEVLPQVVIVSISDSANGSIMENDVIIAIDGESIVNWPLTRLQSRLGPFRHPVNSNINFRFSRKVRKDAKPESTSATPVSPPAAASSIVGNGGGELKLEPKSHSRASSPSHSSAEIRASVAASNAANEAALALQVENSQLAARVHELEKQLMGARRENEMIPILQQQLMSTRDSLASAYQREEYLQLQLAQMFINSTIIGTSIQEQTVRDNFDIAATLQAGRSLHTSPSAEKYMSAHGLGLKEVSMGDDAEILKAQRTALASTSFIEPSGQLLKKWHISGNSARDKLAKFEEKLQVLDGTAPSKSSSGAIGATTADYSASLERKEEQQGGDHAAPPRKSIANMLDNKRASLAPTNAAPRASLAPQAAAQTAPRSSLAPTPVAAAGGGRPSVVNALTRPSIVQRK